MELEERKPKDIFLEIKQETEDFLENVKEEEHSEQIIPKLEEVIEPYSASTSYLPAQANNLIDPVQKFFVETQIFPKLDIEQQEHSELTAPKLDESLEPSTSDIRNQEIRANNPIQKFFIETRKAFPKLEIKSQNRSIVYRGNRSCSVCLKMRPNLSVKTVVRKFDKLVIMIGCILRGDYSVKDAQMFMSGRSHVGICRKHFFDAINEIFNVLHINHPDEIASCSLDSMENVMTIVNALNPLIKTSHFCDNLHDFALVNTTWKRNTSMAEFRCSVCTLNQSIKNMAYLTSAYDKLVIMIGSILRGDYTVKDAQLVLTQKDGLNICCSHFFETINVIFSFLHIKSFEEFLRCSLDSMENVMATVNEVYPWVTIPYFRNVLCDFVRRNKNYLNMTSTSSRMESDAQKPEDILLVKEIKHENENFSGYVKEECEEQKYHEQIMTEVKEEINQCLPINISEFTESTKPKKQIEEFSIQTESIFNTCLGYILKRKVSNKKDPEQYFRKCSVCLELQNTQNMKHVSVDEEKLVIMVGCVLSGDYSLAQAQQFVSRKIHSLICYTHFSQTFEEIFKCLGITNPHEMFSCSAELMQNVMITVNSIRPQTETLQFCYILSSFVRRNFALNS